MSQLNEDYLNEILDKISKFGLSFLTKAEKDFLDAFSREDGQTMNKIQREQISRKFESIDSKFTFILVDVEKKSEEGVFYHGELRVPDLLLANGRTVQGIMNGYIWSINGNNIPVFEKDGYDVLEFCDGIEWEFDIFLDYVISTIKDEKTDF